MKQKLRIVSVWLALGTVCLCSARAARAQSTNASPLQSGVNRLTALTPANTGCGYSPEAVPSCAHPPANKIRQSKAHRDNHRSSLSLPMMTEIPTETQTMPASWACGSSHLRRRAPSSVRLTRDTLRGIATERS